MPHPRRLLPLRLDRLEVHFLRGDPEDSLFELSFDGPAGRLSHLTRCYADPNEFVADACAVSLEGREIETLATSNQGRGPIALTIRGTNERDAWGESEPASLEFAEERIDGAVYYWTASNPESIVRFDFGSGQSAPETFIAPGDVRGNDGACVGCHALSRQGDKMFLSLGSSSERQLEFASDLSQPIGGGSFFTYNGAVEDRDKPVSEQQNRVLLGSFDPTGSQFVSVAPQNDPASDLQLFIHDANTGRRTESIALPVVPSHPDWSPLGDAIAFTTISGDDGVTISLTGGGVSMVRREQGRWAGEAPIEIVPPTAGKNRFNPTVLPDGSLLLYSEVDQAAYSGSHAGDCDATTALSGRFCDGYSDPASRTWAVRPEVGAVPVLLERASAPGGADAIYPPPQTSVGVSALMDTYPRSTPFLSSHRGSTITWFTVSSQRRAGLRRFFPNPSITGEPDTQSLIWMFALDTEQTRAGQDGSGPGFFLPLRRAF